MRSSLRDNAVDNAAILCGYSSCLAYAQDSEELISNLKRGISVKKMPWFESDEAAIKYGVKGNKFAARLVHKKESDAGLVCELIEQSLQKAMLDKHGLSGENVRVYLSGLGPRVDVKDYAEFYDHNDIEDVTLTSSVQKLHLAHMSQDKLAHQVAAQFKLKHLPPSMHCSSNSALAAVHLGIQAIESGSIDLVVVMGYSPIKTQDISFLESQSMLASDVVQPFGEASKSVLFAEGSCAMVLESVRHRRARGKGEDGVRLSSAYAQISAARSNDAAHFSANLLKVINRVMEKAGVTCDDLCAIIPHGNGSESTDKAEAQSLASLAGVCPVPVLAYKGQIGYTPTASGIVDLIIGHHTLVQRELISPVGTEKIRENIAGRVMLNQGIVAHDKHHLLKSGLGVDGSIIAVVMSDTHAVSVS